MREMIIGDAVETMRQMESDSFSCVVTSPPYNIGVDYGPGISDRMSPEDYSEFTKNWVRESIRVAPVLVVNFGTPSSSVQNLGRFISDISSVGVVQSHIVWVKSISSRQFTGGHFKPVNSARFLNNLHESIFIVSRTGNYQLDRLAVGVPFADKSNISRFSGNGGRDMRCRGNVWYLPYETRTAKKSHPATFPQELAEMMIKITGARGRVLDPFAGTGTTLLAAEGLGLDSVGIDIRDW